jgi:phage terminase large subunit
MDISLERLIAPAYYEQWNDIMSGRVTESWGIGGRYAGKSAFAAIVAGAKIAAKGNELIHETVFRRHHVDLEDSVLSEFNTALRDRLAIDKLFYIKKNPLRLIRKDTGQTVTFLGLDDPRKHKSKKPLFGRMGLVWFEEGDEFACWDDIESVIISMQREMGDFTTLVTCNPPRSTAHWINAEAAKPAPGRKVYRYDYRDIMEMGWLPDPVLQRIEHMRKTNYELYRYVFLGHATGTGGEIFKNLRAQKITDEQIKEWKASGKASYGLDFGIINDPTVLVGTYYDSDRDILYVFDEAVLEHPFYDDVYKMLVRKGLDKTEIIADTAPAGWIQNINRLGAKLKGCYKAPDWNELGVSWMASRTMIVCDPVRAPLTFEEMTHFESERYKDGTLKEKLPSRDDHGVDGCRYSQEHNIRASLAKKYVGVPKAIARKFRVG